jgi:hypothetical protein
MTDRELVQQALNLLDDINQCSLPPTGIPLPAEIDHLMEALRARLAQPEREWQGLTDENCEEVERWVEFKEEGSGRIPTLKLIQYIEVKLKEKNSGAG